MKNVLKAVVGIMCIAALSASCKKKDAFELGSNANDSFHVKNGDYLIPVLVRGNTASKKIILYVQGGPGYASLDFARIDYTGWRDNLEKEYAVAYYDQRGTGNRQGNFTQGDNVLKTWVEDLHKVAAFLQKAYDAEIIMLGHSFGGDLVYRYMIDMGSAGIPEKYITTDAPVTTDADTDTLRWKFRRDFLFNTANLEIARGKRVSQWNGVLDWLSATPKIEKLSGDDPYRLMKQWNKYVEELINVDNPERPVQVKDYIKVVFASSYNPLPYLAGGYKEGVITQILTEEEHDFLMNKLSLINNQKLLIITGRYDDICPPEELSYVYDQITSPQKQMQVIDYAGHTPFTNQPTAFADAVKIFIQ